MRKHLVKGEAYISITSLFVLQSNRLYSSSEWEFQHKITDEFITQAPALGVQTLFLNSMQVFHACTGMDVRK